MTAGPCSICGRDVVCPNETPADPPFFPARGGHHCDECELWLLTGETPEGGEQA